MAGPFLLILLRNVASFFGDVCNDTSNLIAIQMGTWQCRAHDKPDYRGLGDDVGRSNTDQMSVEKIVAQKTQFVNELHVKI